MTASLETNQRETVARQYVADVFTGANAERSQVGAIALPWAG